MKKTAALIVTVVIWVLTVPALMAETFSIGFEIPLTYAFEEADDGSSLEGASPPIGALLYAELPFIRAGVGLENYEIELDQSGTHRIATTMIDFFYVLPVPVVNLSLGLGYGQSEVRGDSAAYYEATGAYKYFFRMGIPLGTFMEITASYHRQTSLIKVKDTDYKLQASGAMGAAGMSFGF